MQLRAVREAHFLTFEDVDYKGDANMVGERNWSSLIGQPTIWWPTTLS